MEEEKTALRDLGRLWVELNHNSTVLTENKELFVKLEIERIKVQKLILKEITNILKSK